MCIRDRNQVIQYIVGLHISRLRFHGLAIVEDHHRCGLRGIILRGNKNPIGVLSTREDVAWDYFGLGETPLWHTFHGLGIGTQSVEEVIRIWRSTPLAVARL